MTRVRAALLALIVFCCASALAGEPAFRFESVVPGAQPGTWNAVLAVKGKPEKVKEKLVFRGDAGALAATVDVLGEGRLRATITAPATLARLEAGTSGKTFAPVAAVTLAAGAAPFDDWTIYHVYLATFRDGDKGNDGLIEGWKDKAYAGGDLAGVLLSLDYLKGLGANAVWLSPMFAARTSHGYDVTDYYRIADAVGVAGDPKASLALFEKLVAEAHARGIRVILDIPLNHASRSYDYEHGDPQQLKPRSTGPQQAAEKLWDSWGSPYRYWSFDHEPTRQFLVGVAKYWLDTEGADGLRLDYVRGVPHDFWARLFGAVKKDKPGAFLVGECWADEQGPWGNVDEIATYETNVAGAGRQFDSLLDFPLQDVLLETFVKGGPATALESMLQGEEATYGAGAIPTRFLDNHDLARFMDWTPDKDRLVAALGFMSALRGPVVLFYGTETGLAGGETKRGFTDSGRLPMPWNALDEKLIARVREFLLARAAHPALAHGARLPVSADRTGLVMARTGGGETALVAVNVGKEPREFVIGGAPWFAKGSAPKIVAGPGTITVDAEQGTLRFKVPPLTTAIAAGASR